VYLFLRQQLLFLKQESPNLCIKMMHMAFINLIMCLRTTKIKSYNLRVAQSGHVDESKKVNTSSMIHRWLILLSDRQPHRLNIS
jgi:hypothetical protein